LQLNRHPVGSRGQMYGANEEDIDDKSTIQVRTDDNTIYGEIADVRQAITFEVRAGTVDGMQLEPYRVQIRVQPDAKPSVRFVKPAEELEALATAEVPLLVEAGDDLGLHKVGIGFQVAGGPMQSLWEDDYAGGSVKIQSHEVLALEDHNVRFPGSVNYFAFAEDNYFGEPRRSVTPLRFVDIRPFKREYQLLDNGGT